MMNKNLFSKKAGISYFQIAIIVISSFAIAYLLYSETKSIDAQVDGGICCEKTKSGAFCQQVSNSNECIGKTSPTECKESDFCELGCCISSQTGLCDENSPKAACPKDNFKDDATCNMQNCKKACCILGNNAKWTNEKNCEIEASSRGLPVNFAKEIKSEVSCLFSVEKDKEGACVFDSETNGCKFTTLEECNTRTKNKGVVNPNFYEGRFCSDPQLNTSCKAKEHKGCLKGKEDVYWFDSCNNHEDIADDCELSKSSYCGKQGTEYICKDTSCDINGKKRKSGESWCEYDEVIGKGKDLVGSRHLRHICYMGQEKIEPCADYRNEICVQTDNTITGGVISQAACRVNNWRSCFSYDLLNESDMVKKCEKNPDCFVREVNVDKQFHFKLCVPQYPPGFELKIDEEKLMDENYQSSAESLCSIGSQQCTVVYVCSIFGCQIKVNGNCLKKTFSEQMNEMCVNLGDCGGYINYNGDVTQGGYIITSDGDKPKKLTIQDIISLKSKAGKKPAEPGEIDFLGIIGNSGSLVGFEEETNISEFEKELQGLSGALGSQLLVKILSGESIESSASSVAPKSIDFSKFSNGFATIKAGISSKYELKKILGMPIGSLVGGGIGGVLGGLLGYQAFAGTSYALAGAIGGALIFGLILFFFFFVKIKYVHVNFKCLPWQLPLEGNCNACNKIDFPCTEYRCETLGENCELINKGTGDELCVSKKVDSSVPQIKPWSIIITKGYEYYNVNQNNFQIVNSTNKGCIEAFTNVKFGIQTVNTNGENQYTQCKIDADASKTFDDMADYFDENHPNSFLPYHMRSMFVPSPEALRNKYNLTEEQIKKLGELKFYIRCRNLKGVENQAFEIKICANPGPDLTAPVITRTEPENQAYLKFGALQGNLRIYVNEPAECKWSKEDKKYLEMENPFVCDNDLEQYTRWGWLCNTNLTNVQNTTQYYIKCQDKSENKNSMTSSYVYNLFYSNSELVIKNMKPENGEEIISGTDPAKVILRLETERGAENGKAICEWEGDGYGPDIFTETNSSFHSYELRYLNKGMHNINFRCKDIAGNSAEASVSFSLIMDDSGPKITRIYNSGGLKVITSENAECRYDFNRKFLFENASSMGGIELEHNAEWRINNYYIQCRDNFENKGGLIQVRTYNP